MPFIRTDYSYFMDVEIATLLKIMGERIERTREKM